MNILICTAQVPFVSGGAEVHVENLRRALVKAGHVADVVSLPFKWYPPREIIRSALAWRMLDVTEANGKPVDMVIGMKFPAYLVEHPRKVLWVIHQYRSAYEMAGTDYDDFHGYADGARTRAFVKHVDERFIPRALKVYANSQNVAARMLRYNNIQSEPLYHPPPRAELLAPGAQGNYIFYPSRLEPQKRQEVLIEAARHLKSDAKIILAGGGRKLDHYQSLINRDRKIRQRVELRGFVSEDEMLKLYRDALAVCFLPWDEDYGYVSLEAMYAGKPLIVARDGGGATEFIEHGREGLIVDPSPEAVAHAIDELYLDRQRATQMGERGRKKVLAMKLSWEHVVEKLTQPVINLFK
ncbi:MAG TPA: glycosyltransferase family 4 protein [Pyrinomonadaceae bacterium]|jgi:glycosyltransferase involved in cell wall biosynthesis|nr:glycosyltransferase family 4 protein [Pyrinomonadaceae bacterium]